MSVSHRWRAPCSHNVLLALSVMMSHQTHFAVISVMIMICLFFQRLSIWLPGFRTSNWADKHGHRPPSTPTPPPSTPTTLCVSYFSTHFHGGLLSLSRRNVMGIWQMPYLYRPNISDFSCCCTTKHQEHLQLAEHQTACVPCTAWLKWNLSSWKELRRFDAFSCNISPSLKHIMQKKYIKWRQAPKRSLISLIGW